MYILGNSDRSSEYINRYIYDNMSEVIIIKIKDIYDKCFQGDFHKSMRSGNNGYVYTLTINKKIIGFVSIKFISCMYHFHNLCILPDYQNNGYGTFLMDHIKDECGDISGYCKKSLLPWFEKIGFYNHHTNTKNRDTILISTMTKIQYDIRKMNRM